MPSVVLGACTTIDGAVQLVPPSVLRVIASWMLFGRSSLLLTRASATAITVPSSVTAIDGIRTEATVPL